MQVKFERILERYLIDSYCICVWIYRKKATKSINIVHQHPATLLKPPPSMVILGGRYCRSFIVLLDHWNLPFFLLLTLNVCLNLVMKSEFSQTSLQLGRNSATEILVMKPPDKYFISVVWLMLWRAVKWHILQRSMLYIILDTNGTTTAVPFNSIQISILYHNVLDMFDWSC